MLVNCLDIPYYHSGSNILGVKFLRALNKSDDIDIFLGIAI